MKLKSIEDIDLKGKTILYRAPYDIDVEEVKGVLTLVDDMRIRATLPTLKYLLKQKCKIVIMTYVGRPDGKIVEKLRTTLHAEKLSKLLKHPVKKVDECIGKEVNDTIAKMKGGNILMLENVRFHAEEMLDDDNFAKELCVGKDMIVFDGFPQALRIHASTTGIQRHLPSVAGHYLRQEVNMLSSLLDTPAHPFTVIIGGAKISDKVDAIANLLPVADYVIVGGGVANVFMRAEGRVLGDSFIEDVFVDKAKRKKRDWVEDAKSIIKEAQMLKKHIIIPSDLVIAKGDDMRIIKDGEVPPGWRALDIGPDSTKNFTDIISKSKTVFMNGPVGKFEDERFSTGSRALLDAMKKVKGEIIVAGGDTINLARRYSKLKDYSHVSLAGGTTLEFIAGKDLPGLLPLIEKSL